ncbi:MAG: ATP-binding cassette domain-containing protein, partial [Anaerolineales bacterium]|nr:ATP-binding cassette domain-containing protein [Anaerolineales bacterium]MDW8447882.1 ATP-binding cassette domain-containing protein [Anaerolineales bacterium]
LTPQEVDELFKIMKSLVAGGKSIIFITHKLREVLEFSDRITVIRNGRVVGTTTPQEADQSKLASMMVGRQIEFAIEKKPAEPKEVVLEVRNLKVLDARQLVAVNGVSFEVHAGEVLGIAGVQGNGQTELVRALTGMQHPVEGEIRIFGKVMTHASPREFFEMGAAHIPEDRQRDGLVLTYPVKDNFILNTFYKPPYARGIVLQQPAIAAHAEELVRRFDIRTPSIFTELSALSGGNQQKVIVAREFSRPLKLLIAAQPTRGLDVGSIEYIHHRLLEKRDEGCAVLLISTELDEILQLSDRIAVMYRGRIVATVNAAETTKEELGLYMAGMQPETLSLAQVVER